MLKILQVGLNREHAVAALLEKVLREAEEVVHIKQTQRSETELKILIQLAQKAACLYLKFRVLFYENAIVAHMLDCCV